MMKTTQERLDEIILALDELTTSDLRTVLFMLQSLESKADKAMLVHKIRIMVRTCPKPEAFIAKWNACIEHKSLKHIKELADNVQ